MRGRGEGGVFSFDFFSSFLFLPLKSKPRRGSSTGQQIEGFVYLTLLDHEGGEGVFETGAYLSTTVDIVREE